MTDNQAAGANPIRSAVVEDYDDILAVWSAAGLKVSRDGRDGAPAFREQLVWFADLYLVACDGDRIVGVVLGTHDLRKGWINRLAVLPEYRGRGIATALVSACDTALRGHGIHITAALVEPPNPASSRVMEKLGFRTDVAVTYFRKAAGPEA